MYWLPVLFVAVTACTHAKAQLTAQTSVAPELRECYLDPQLFNRNNLPPATIQVLIDIIRHIEDNPNVNMDLRQLSAMLLHTYRQDGIEYHQPESTVTLSSNVLPYAPTFHSFQRHRLLLTRLIPSNLQVLANDTISSQFKCALHHMLSTTIDARVRGDENTCNQLSQYRALRTARSIDDDVEILNPSQLNSANKNGHMRQFNPNDDVEYTNYGGAMSEKQLLGDSTCPLLDGVIFTDWGELSAGNVIAGIAAGAQPQQVPVLELAKGSALNYLNVQPTVLSLYPATVTGDLAEAILIQGTERGSATISVGSAGGWNSTQAPRHYMLHSRLNPEMTDPEIRGDQDGFILGHHISSSLSSYSSLRLSTLLDMYYSPRNGVFRSDYRACNRRIMSQQLITNDRLLGETYAFSAALDTNMALRGTIIGGLDSLVTSAVNNYQSYSTNTMNEMNCETSENTINDHRSKTNLYIVLDSSWQYSAVYPAISYLLDGIEVSKFGSSVTLLNAFDGSVIVNTTFSIAEFHTNYTLLAHQSITPTGVNLQTSLTNIRTRMQESLRDESLRNYVGGNSTVLLYLISSSNLQNNEAVWEQARLLNDTVPDLRILFATSTNQFDNLWNLVRDMHNDIKTIALSTAGTNVEIVMSPILERIQQVGRRIVNPLCGSEFTAGLSGTRQFDDFVEPGFINFYTLSPNYFFEHHDNRRIRIARSSSGVGNLVVCHSRRVPQPRRNITIIGEEEDVIVCESLASNGNIEIHVQNGCSDYWTINTCPPLYISVQSDAVATATTTAVCTDQAACRFPYDIRYQVQIEDLGCFSGARSLGASVLFVLFAYIFTVVRPF